MGSVVQTGASVEVFNANVYVFDDGSFRPLPPGAIVISVVAEALEVKLGRAAAKMMPATSMARKTNTSNEDISSRAWEVEIDYFILFPT